MPGSPGPEAGSLNPGPRAAWWWLGVVVLAGIAIRAPFLGQPMRQDEADTVVLFAMTPVRHILVDTAIPNNHILHSLLVRVAMAVFGSDPWVVRLPALLAGVMLIPLSFLVGRAFYSIAAGLLAAAMVAVSTPLVLYSANARGYTLIACATLACLLFLQRALASNSWRAWLGFAVCAATGAFVNPSMLYPVGGMALWALAEVHTSPPAGLARLPRLVVACLGAAAFALVAYAPALAVSGWRSVVGNSYVRPLPWARFVHTLPGFAADLAAYPGRGWPLALQLAVGLCLLVGLGWHARLARHRWSAALFLLGWAVVLLLAMRRAPFLRVWLYLLPMFAVAAGAGLATMLSWGNQRAGLTRAGVVAAVLAVAMGWRIVDRRTPDLLTETGVFRDGPAMAERLAGMVGPGDVIAARWLSQGPVDYYLRRLGVKAPFVVNSDSVAGRLYLLVAEDTEDTPRQIVSYRKLRGVNPAQAREVARFSRSSVWLVDVPAGAAPVVADTVVSSR